MSYRDWHLEEMHSLIILPGGLKYPWVGFLDVRKTDESNTFPPRSSKEAFLLGRDTSLEGKGDNPEKYLVVRLIGAHSTS